MKLQNLLSAVILITSVALSSSTYAEEKAAPATEVKAEKAAPSQASKPDSHVQEKTRVPQNAQSPEPTKKNPAKDMSKHYHPRDMK